MTEVCRVLVVEPSDLFRGFLDAVMDDAGYDVLSVAPDEHMASLLQQQEFHVVILASAISPKSGGALRLAKEARQRGSAVIIALDEPWHRAAFAGGDYSFLWKPFRPRDLVALVERLIEEREMDCEPSNATTTERSEF
jgi:DNA-binding NtrC family response regulator